MQINREYKRICGETTLLIFSYRFWNDVRLRYLSRMRQQTRKCVRVCPTNYCIRTNYCSYHIRMEIFKFKQKNDSCTHVNVQSSLSFSHSGW